MECRARATHLLISFRAACRAGVGSLVIGTYRLVAAFGIATFMMSMTGCYSYPPRPLSDVSRSAAVSAEITDVGRVALAEPIGSGVARVDGRVLEVSDSTVRLAVTEVTFLSGLSNKWQGQDVTLRLQDVKSISQRTYSKQRTAVAIILGAVLAGAILVAGFTGLFSGDGGRDKTVDPPPVT